jgi:hypothetical protein
VWVAVRYVVAAGPWLDPTLTGLLAAAAAFIVSFLGRRGPT